VVLIEFGAFADHTSLGGLPTYKAEHLFVILEGLRVFLTPRQACILFALVLKMRTCGQAGQDGQAVFACSGFFFFLCRLGGNFFLGPLEATTPKLFFTTVFGVVGRHFCLWQHFNRYC